MLSNEELGIEFERVRVQDPRGLLRPKSIVDAARPIDSPLHAHFEWDAEKGAEDNRIEQARRLIRVVVTRAPNPHQNVLVRTYVSLSADRRQPGDGEESGAASGYRLTSEVMSNTQLRAILLADALRELRTFEAKYSKLEQLRPVFEAMQRVRSGPQPRRPVRKKTTKRRPRRGASGQ